MTGLAASQPGFGNYASVDVEAWLPVLPEPTWTQKLAAACTEAIAAYWSVSQTYYKAMANGVTTTIGGMLTLGFVDDEHLRLFTPTEQDYANGYAYMEAGAKIVTTVGIAVGTMGVGCVASVGSTAAKVAVFTVRTVEAANATKDVVAGGIDIVQNGANLKNTTQVLGGLITGIGLGGSKCFTEGTQIVVGAEYDEHDVFVQYVTVNIEDIKVGDWVYSYNTLTGEIELAEVIATFSLKSNHINYLTVVDENGNEQAIETTDAHPFWVVTDDPDLERAARSVVDENGVILYHHNIGPGLNGFWVEAKDLRVSDVFLGANGELTTLTNIVRVEQSGGINVFNFTVAGNHNYFILTKEYGLGQTSVLVHNGDCLVGRVNDVHDALKGIEKNKRTTAGLVTKDGRTIIGSGGTDLNAAQRARLRTGEIAAKLADEHAEITVLFKALELNKLPSMLVASRKFCPECIKFIKDWGGKIIDKNIAIW